MVHISSDLLGSTKKCLTMLSSSSYYSSLIFHIIQASFKKLGCGTGLNSIFIHLGNVAFLKKTPFKLFSTKTSTFDKYSCIFDRVRNIRKYFNQMAEV